MTAWWFAEQATSTTHFHILSFEGPDPYSQAGGIAHRISGLARALPSRGFETHLWFVGDPENAGHERRGTLHLHRWCQWISRHHPGGVYDGEEGKCADYAGSLAPYLFAEKLLPHLRTGGRAVILAEEWHTVDAVLHLDWLLRRAELRDRVKILWNANNTFGFHRIDWPRLARAATITTVSRFMKHQMWALGVDPVVIPNGLSAEAFELPRDDGVAEIRRRSGARLLLAKVARWDPEKRWLQAIRIVGELKRVGLRPLLLARGGVEAHGSEVFQEAAAQGLRIVERRTDAAGIRAVTEVLDEEDGSDVVALTAPLDAEAKRALFHAADAVLANSGREPFGLVGLETMAVGGVACTGATGEDYAVAGKNALVLQTDDPREFLGLFAHIRRDPRRERALRSRGRATAREYTWSEVIRRDLLPRVSLARA